MLYDNKVSADFAARVQTMATDLVLDPDWLMYIMNNETAGTFSPSIKNPNSSATGLIQFLESTAANLGTTTDDLAAMSAVDQLSYVERYFAGVIASFGAITTVSDCYLAVFYPAAISWDTARQFSSSAYNQNKIFDYDNLGYLTKQDFADYVNYHYSLVATSPADSVIPALSTDSLLLAQDYTVLIIGGAILVFCTIILFLLIKISENGHK